MRMIYVAIILRKIYSMAIFNFFKNPFHLRKYHRCATNYPFDHFFKMIR